MLSIMSLKYLFINMNVCTSLIEFQFNARFNLYMYVYVYIIASQLQILSRFSIVYYNR